MHARAVLRRCIPFEIRRRVRLLRRHLNDRQQHVHFARGRAPATSFPHVVCSYSLPYIDYPGQEQWSLAKRHNQELLAASLSGTVVQPGETFSIWHIAGRPRTRDGYLPAAALKNHQMTAEVGGSVCFLSTILYNVGLLGALEVPERYCHSIDSYGDRRYFQLGRDASIEFGYRDLRLYNPHPFPVFIEIETSDHAVTATLRSPEPRAFTVEIEVDRPRLVVAPWSIRIDRSLGPSEQRIVRQPLDGLEVSARRVVQRPGQTSTIEPLPGSSHRPIPGELTLGAARTGKRRALQRLHLPYRDRH